jgi:PadR family transcriptional regulator, regulatory protein PadR
VVADGSIEAVRSGLDTGSVEDRSARLMTAALDICLLSLIAEKERYGYDLIRTLEEEGLKLVKEGSIYPLLRRMEREELIQGRIVPSPDGPARKYYRILPKGEERLLVWAGGFMEFADAVKGIIEKRIDLERQRPD